jgi:hypothetical protein
MGASGQMGWDEMKWVSGGMGRYGKVWEGIGRGGMGRDGTSSARTLVSANKCSRLRNIRSHRSSAVVPPLCSRVSPLNWLTRSAQSYTCNKPRLMPRPSGQNGCEQSGERSGAGREHKMHMSADEHARQGRATSALRQSEREERERERRERESERKRERESERRVCRLNEREREV